MHNGDKKKGKPGRRAVGKYGETIIDWDAARDWYITGKYRGVDDKGREFTRDVRYADIAERFGTTVQNIGYHASKKPRKDGKPTWLDLRDEYRKKLDEEMTVRMAQARAHTTADLLAIVEEGLTTYQIQNREGAGKMSVADLKALVSIKILLENYARETRGRPNEELADIDDLAARHAEYLADHGRDDDDDDVLSGTVREQVGLPPSPGGDDGVASLDGGEAAA